MKCTNSCRFIVDVSIVHNSVKYCSVTETHMIKTGLHQLQTLIVFVLDISCNGGLLIKKTNLLGGLKNYEMFLA